MEHCIKQLMFSIFLPLFKCWASRGTSWMSLEMTVYADSVQGHWYTAICVHCHWFALGLRRYPFAL